MKDHLSSGKDSISVINFLAEFKRVSHSLYIHEGAAVWIFRDFLVGLVLAVIRACLILSLNDVNMRKGALILYDEVVNHLSSHYTLDAVISMGDDEIQNFKQGSLTPGKISQELWSGLSFARSIQQADLMRIIRRSY